MRLNPWLFSALLLFPAVAVADDPAPSFHEQLRHRNARYAVLDRVDDPQGDAHERLLYAADLVRAQDVLGDREEKRRDFAFHKTPPQAVRFAAVARTEGVEGDLHERFLASTSNARRYADLSRLRDLTSDRDIELAAYRDFRIRVGIPLPGADAEFIVRHAEVGDDVVVRRYYLERDDVARGAAELIDTDRDIEALRERRDEERFERLMERDEAQSANRREREDERDEEALLEETEREFDRDAERAEDELEGDLEADLERAEDQAERELEGELEREAEGDEARQERADERESERAEERDLDREIDQQLEKDESED